MIRSAVAGVQALVAQLGIAAGFFMQGPTAVLADDVPEVVDFERQIKPILATHCWHCHGADSAARQAELRLDIRDGRPEFHGASHVIDSDQPERSEFLRRIQSRDPDQQMPPPDQDRQLSREDMKLLRRWIREGAEYQPHWSFRPVNRPTPPTSRWTYQVKNPVDAFVHARLGTVGLQPSPLADRPTLIRRVTLDLTGLPPTPEQVAEFLADPRHDAYERVVDRLLADPGYGERMSLPWLDAARFADSGGYQGDILRSMYLWRDWVITAYNSNRPFDQFTTEQLAGDLLENPTADQLIATGFNRNHRINDEDGIVLEEFLVEYVADRVETTATTWLGLTVGCARCHDHKYDPVSQRDYYRLFAFFHSIDEQGRGHGNAAPLFHYLTDELRVRIDNYERELEQLRLRKPEPEDAAQRRKELQKAIADAHAAAPSVMIMRERQEPRTTHVLIRGAYDRPGEIVTAGFPSALSERIQHERSERGRSEGLDRMDLAEWLLSPRNPLTARVAVNRYWQMYFGRGLVDTAEDFGTRGTLPSHPQLLDWLASEFVHSGWDVKHLQRLIVTSRTYRQSSDGTVQSFEADPQNRWLGRGARFRLQAEFLRDQALAASGLLDRRIGGPSVKPYQPEGLWDELASASRRYEPSTGPDLYRRGMYTFVRRTIPHPAMTELNAPNREICTVRRATTNTPMQALVLLNDPQLIEAARHLAAKVLKESAGIDDRIDRLYLRLTARHPTTEERQILRNQCQHFLERYRTDPASAKRLVSVGQSLPSPDLDVSELAAWTAVANTMMNLDEVVTRE